jgi:hypothetical protein
MFIRGEKLQFWYVTIKERERERERERLYEYEIVLYGYLSE